MYPNIMFEKLIKRVTNQDIAKMLDVRPATITDKMKGRSAWTLPEALAIKDFLRSELTLEELFKWEDDKTS